MMMTMMILCDDDGGDNSFRIYFIRYCDHQVGLRM